jgi:hypothetical protein
MYHFCASDLGKDGCSGDSGKLPIITLYSLMLPKTLNDSSSFSMN